MLTEVQSFQPESGEAEMRRALELLQNAGQAADQQKIADLEARLAASDLLVAKVTRGRSEEKRRRQMERQTHNEFARRAKILVEQLASKATKDSMTGLLNKASFNEVAQEIHDRFQTEDVILMFDIDDFKAKNSRYGHLEADKALQMIADFVKANVRSIDLVGAWPENPSEAVPKAGRWGGEEFAVMFPKATPKEIAASGKFIIGPNGELRINVEPRLKVQETGEYEQPTITVSGALAAWNPGEPLEQVLERANKKLNEIKASKIKNRIEIAD